MKDFKLNLVTLANLTLEQCEQFNFVDLADYSLNGVMIEQVDGDETGLWDAHLTAVGDGQIRLDGSNGSNGGSKGCITATFSGGGSLIKATDSDDNRYMTGNLSSVIIECTEEQAMELQFKVGFHFLIMS